MARSRGWHRRRLEQAVAHLHGAAAAESDDVGTVGTELDGFGLSAEALEQFNRVGYVIIPTNLSREFCDGFYAAAEAQGEAQKKPTELTFAQRIKPENQDAANARGEAPAASLGPTPEDHAAVLESPSVRGALTSMLGPDYLAPSFGALHQGMQQEQPFHCDGTDHAVTLTTVRDHKPRRLIAMFYPGDVSRDMGPT